MVSKQKYVQLFEGGQFDNNATQIISIDSIGFVSIVVYNTSLAGDIIVLPNTVIEPGKYVTFEGKENQNFVGKIEIKLFNFFANIEYGYAVIKKKYVSDAKL